MLVALAVAVVALAGVVVWATRDVARGPVAPSATSTSPAPTEASTEAAQTPSAVPRDVGEPVDLRDLVEQVARIRRLEPRDRLRSRRVSEAVLADKVSEIAFSELDLVQVAADERLLVALRLAPESFDLAASLEALYREQVLGLYVPKEKTLYVRSRGEASPAERVTTAHEVTHALQDQHFNLVRLQRRFEDDTDAGLAVLSLIEGDAVLTQQLWALQHLSTEEQQQAVTEGGQGGDALADAPEYLRASLFFPYRNGAQFVVALFRDGGFAAVDDAFRNPPTTSEHILHPERYLQGDDPTAVEMGRAPSGEWADPVTYEFGEFDLLELLRPLGDDTAETAATGWDGGRIRMWHDDEAVAVAAVLAFDSAGDAAEACNAVPAWYREVADASERGAGEYASQRDHLVVRCGATDLRFGLAPDAETARHAASPP